MDLCQVFFKSLKFARQTAIGFSTFPQPIDRVTEAAEITAQSRAEIGQGQVILIPDQKGNHCPGFVTPSRIRGRRSYGPMGLFKDNSSLTTRLIVFSKSSPCINMCSRSALLIIVW